MNERLEHLARRAASGDREARAHLVEEASPLVRRLARRYAGRGVEIADLEQEAMVGILRALGSFDPARGPFGAWATVWARQALQQSIAEHGRPLRLSRHVLWDLHQVKETQAIVAQRLGREPRALEVADVLGWTRERVEHALALGQAPGEPEAADLVEDPLAQDVYEDVVTRLAARQVEPLLGRLTSREREVLELRAAGRSLRSIGRLLGVSGQRVDAIAQRAGSKVAALAEAPRVENA